MRFLYSTMVKVIFTRGHLLNIVNTTNNKVHYVEYKQKFRDRLGNFLFATIYAEQTKKLPLDTSMSFLSSQRRDASKFQIEFFF